MAKHLTRHQQRYQILRSHHFSIFEAKAYSDLPRRTPALLALIADRDIRWARFEKLAAHKIASNSWLKRDLDAKWQTNLQRMYRRKHWLVQDGPKGTTIGRGKGTPSPWAQYRDYTDRFPGKNYVSPWEVKQILRGKTALDRGLLFVQRTKVDGLLSTTNARRWISELDASIKRATGQHKKQLTQQRDRLRKALA